MQKNPATIAGIAIFISIGAGVMNGEPAGNAMVSVFSFPAGAGLLSLLKRGVDIQDGGPRSFCSWR